MVIAKVANSNKLFQSENKKLKIALVCSWVLFLAVLVYKL